MEITIIITIVVVILSMLSCYRCAVCDKKTNKVALYKPFDPKEYEREKALFEFMQKQKEEESKFEFAKQQAERAFYEYVISHKNAQ